MAVIALTNAVLAANSVAAFAEPAPAYHLVDSVPLGAPDRWDYVVFDAPSHRVYVAHGDRVSVIDGRDGAVVGQVEGAPGGTHGIGLSHATGKGYTDDGKAGVAVVFDLKTLKTLKTIPAQDDADGIAFDQASGHIFVVDGDTTKITVIDPVTDTAAAAIDGGGKLEYAVSDDQGHLYVNGEAKREIVRIDTRTNAVDAHWPMADCADPHGLAIDKAAHRLFASCVNAKLMVIDADTGALVAVLPIGRGSDAVAFDPVRKRVFSSDGLDGIVSIFQQTGPDAYVALPPVKTAVSGRTMALDPQTGRLYIAASDVEPSAAPGARPKPKPGALKLLFLDPTDASIGSRP
jgi:DNA-binding beta-propeller fold protein YncE